MLKIESEKIDCLHRPCSRPAPQGKIESVRTHSEVIGQFDSFSPLKLLFLAGNWHCWSRKAFPRQMTPQSREKTAKTTVFRHRWRAWKVVQSIAAVRQRPRTPQNWRCSIAFFESFLWHFNKKQCAEVIFRLSRPVSCKNQKYASGKQWSLHAPLYWSNITWCVFMKCDQWCQRTILSGCEYTYSLGTNEIAWLRSPDVCSWSVISDVRGPYCLGVRTHTVLGQWNCLTDITWCLFMKCDQWCLRTILSGCAYTYSLGTMKLPDWHHLVRVHEVWSVMLEGPYCLGVSTHSLGTMKLPDWHHLMFVHEVWSVMSADHIVWVWVHIQSWDNEIAWLTSSDVCSWSVISDVRGPYCLGVSTHTVLGQWNCLTDITWCLFMKCDQWCQRTILSGCEYT